MENIRINPYNSNNFLASKEQINNILKQSDINIPIKNLSIYNQAFTHKSYIKQILANRTLDIHDSKNDALELQDVSNERLEFLGDCIANSIIVYYLFIRFPTEQEGVLTKLKTKLISTEYYSKFARYLKLGKHLIISKHVDEHGNGRDSEKMLENVFESFIGALFLDFSNIPSVYTEKLGLLSGPGYEVCQKFVIQLLEKLIDFDDLRQNDDNFKDILLRHYQATFQITPKYTEIRADGPPNNRIFTMGVFDKDGKIVGKGFANSKKKAEQIASRNALKHFGKL
jgi:ribonuclease-3